MAGSKRLRSRILLAALLAAAFGSRDARAQPPSGAAPDGRVLFAPRLGSDVTHGPGRLCACGQDPGGRPIGCACDPRDPAREALMPYEGLTAQNLGAAPTRFAVAYFERGFANGDCEECGYWASACSPVVAPGGTWTFSPYALGAPNAPVGGAAAAVVYALNPLEARLYGGAWESWLRESGLEEDTTLADLACRFLAHGTYGPELPPPEPPGSPGASCAPYVAFHQAFGADGGLLPETPLPIAPLRGEPMAAVVASVTTAGSPERYVLDRTEAVSTRDAAPWDEGPSPAVVAPGGSGRTEDGANSVLAVQNTGAACVVATVQPHRARFGAFGEPKQLTLPPGMRVELDVGATWPALRQGAAIVVSGGGSVATTLTNQGVATSATLVGRRLRDVPATWLFPRAYQERRPIDLDAGDLGTADLAAAEGWQSNLSIFNPSRAQAPATLRYQASGEPPRPLLDYPVEAESQVVLQPGFGLGVDGGPGWVEIASGAVPMTAAAENLRTARGLRALVIEASAAAGVPRGASEVRPRVIGLPDLGGPAVGALPAAEIISRTTRMTDSLKTRLAIQNPLTVTARVAIDSYGQQCGYAGTVERSIDPRQTLVLDADELPGTAFGADAALVRVLDGDAAVWVETARDQWLDAAPDAVPPDLTTAYVGEGTDLPPAPPAPAGAALGAVPDAIALTFPTVPDAPITATISVVDVRGSGRCLSVRVASSEPWLRASSERVAVPGQLALEIDPARLPAGLAHEARITLTAEQLGVSDRELVVPVTVTVLEPASRPVYLPLAVRGTVVP